MPDDDHEDRERRTPYALQIRLTSREIGQLRAAAQRAGMATSAWARTILLATATAREATP